MRYQAVVLIGLAVAVSGCMHVSEAQPTADEETTETPDAGEENTSSESQNIDNPDNVVSYTSNGFSPQTITIEQGETVTWVNENGPMWIGSDRHPTHTQYDGTSTSQHCRNGESDTFDQCSTGDRYSFTFEKTGEWSYHNHRNAGDRGTVIVE